MLDKETINLPVIVDILGERPYGMNETTQKYLVDMKKRAADEEEQRKAELED